MTNFEISGQVYERCKLGLADFKRIDKYCAKLGFEDLSDFLNRGGQSLFDGDAIYLFMALMFSEDGKGDFSDTHVAKREKLFGENEIPPEAAGEAISFFFTRFLSLSESSPTTLYLLMGKGRKRAQTSKTKAGKKSTTRRSSRRSSSKSDKATQLGVVHTKTAT